MPRITINVLILKIYEKAKAVIVCVPIIGIKPMKLPIAMAKAISLGERPFLLKRIIEYFSFEKYFKTLFH